jgi:hypothetical protein
MRTACLCVLHTHTKQVPAGWAASACWTAAPRPPHCRRDNRSACLHAPATTVLPITSTENSLAVTCWHMSGGCRPAHQWWPFCEPSSDEQINSFKPVTSRPAAPSCASACWPAHRSSSCRSSSSQKAQTRQYPKLDAGVDQRPQSQATAC